MNPEPFLFMHGSIVADYAEYSKQDVIEIADKMSTFKQLTMHDFNGRPTQEDFYLNSKTYIYDLLTAHGDLTGPANKIHKFLPGLLNQIKQHPGKKFLEFGGGIGDFCQILYEWGGKEVTYMDIQSHITDFAAWRYAKYNVSITMQIIPQDSFTLKDTYDFIYQDAVLEHLDAQKQLDYTDKLCKGLNAGGLFIMIVDLGGATANMPMHFNVDIVKVHDMIKINGFICERGENQFASVWRKP